MTHPVLHEEARPLALHEMVDDQRAVTVSALRLLTDMANEVASSRERETKGDADRSPLTELVAIERMRSARTMLIDGERGTGKTAVLITLVKLFARAASGLSNDWCFDPPTDDSDERASKSATMSTDPTTLSREEDAFKRLTKVAWLIPTPIIDLQPLPDSAHLLLHVASQFLRLVSLVDPDVSSWTDRPASAPNCVARGQKFYQTAGKVWGRANERRNRLSPEEHALELADVERDRVELGMQYREFIDELAAELGRYQARQGHGSHRSHQVLLVVPIDDADMNPWRSVELLELARWLYHPQVIFLLAGDSDMFRRELRVEAWGAVMDPIKNVSSSIAPEGLYSPRTVTLLALDTFDKVIPPSHRLRLSKLGPSEIWRRATVIRSILASVDVREAPHRLTLEQWIDDSQLQSALPAQLRALRQFAPRLRAILESRTNSPPSMRAVAIAAQLARRAITRSGLIHDVARPYFANDDDLQPGEDEIDFLAPPLKFELATSATVRVGSTDGDERRAVHILAPTAPLRAKPMRPLGRDGEDGQAANDDARYAPVIPQLCAAIMLYREMVAIHASESNPHIPNTPLVYGVVELAAGRQTTPWPPLNFASYLDLRQTLAKLHDNAAHRGNGQEHLLVAFVEHLIGIHPPSEPARKDGLLRIATAVQKAAALRETESGAHLAITLAAPEYGLSRDLSARWLTALREGFGRTWASVVSHVSDLPTLPRRAERPPDHPWVLEFGRVTTAGRLLVDAIRRNFFRPEKLLGLSSSQAAALAQLDGVSAETVSDLLRDAADVLNSYEWMLAMLWAALDDDAANLARASGYKVTLGEDHLEVAPRISPETEAMTDRALEFGAMTLFRVGVVDSDAAARFQAAFAPPGIFSLHALASDCAFEQRSVADKSPLPFAAAWPGVRRRDRGRGKPLWPSPGYRTFTDEALLCDAWNATWEQLRSMGSRLPKGQAMDSIALAYCWAIIGITRARSAASSRIGRVTASEWQEVHVALRDTRSAVAVPFYEREVAFVAWLPRWRVLAAPEYGLSERSALAILSLDGLDEVRASLIEERHHAIPEAERRPRGAPKGGRPHPWFTYVEPQD